MKSDILNEDVYFDSENFCDYLINLCSTHPDTEQFWSKMMRTQESQTFNFIKFDMVNENLTNIRRLDNPSISAFMSKYEKQLGPDMGDLHNSKFKFDEIMLLHGDKLYMFPNGKQDKYYNIVNYSIICSLEAFKFIINSRESIEHFDDNIDNIERYLQVAYLVRNFDVIHILEEKLASIVKYGIKIEVILTTLLLQMVKGVVLLRYIPSMKELCLNMMEEYCDEVNYILAHYDVNGVKMTVPTFSSDDGNGGGNGNNTPDSNLVAYYIKVIKNSFPIINDTSYGEIERYISFTDGALDICMYLFMLINDDAYEAVEKIITTFRIGWHMDVYLQTMSKYIDEIPLANISKALAHSAKFDYNMRMFMNGEWGSRYVDLVIRLCRDRKKLNKFPIEQKLALCFNDDVEYYNIKEAALPYIVKLVVAADEYGIDLNMCLNGGGSVSNESNGTSNTTTTSTSTATKEDKVKKTNSPVEFIRKLIKALYYQHVVSKCVDELEKLNKIKFKYSPEK